MMNEQALNTLKSVANESLTAKTVFGTFANRKRFRYNTNLQKFENILLNRGEKIVHNEFMEVFKKLETQGIGSIIYGRGKKPTRFRWNYNLKDVAKAANGQTIEVQELPKKAEYEGLTPKRGPGRPRKEKVTASFVPGTRVMISIDAETLKPILEALAKMVK